MDEREQLIERIERAEDRYLEIWSTNLTSPLQSVDLTMQQLKTLMLLSFRDGLSGHELSEALGVGLAAVTGMANRLTDRGLVRRAEDPTDRRVRRVYLTEQGTELLAKIRHAGRVDKRRQLRRLTMHNLLQMAEAMEALYEAAETE
jgi:DNA-binding MarR family transcriptional regulator